MLIDFRVIAHKRQRYETCGDYFTEGGTTHFRVSRMKDRRYCLLVFAHELIEYLLCRAAGVRMREIDRFDIAYEKARESHGLGTPCGCDFCEEPGDDPHAPYHKQHLVATACEGLIAEALGVDWEAYGRAVEKL